MKVLLKRITNQEFYTSMAEFSKLSKAFTESEYLETYYMRKACNGHYEYFMKRNNEIVEENKDDQFKLSKKLSELGECEVEIPDFIEYEVFKKSGLSSFHLSALDILFKNIPQSPKPIKTE